MLTMLALFGSGKVALAAPSVSRMTTHTDSCRTGGRPNWLPACSSAPPVLVFVQPEGSVPQVLQVQAAGVSGPLFGSRGSETLSCLTLVSQTSGVSVLVMGSTTVGT